MPRSTPGTRLATLGAVCGLLVGACATTLPVPSGPSASASASGSPALPTARDDPAIALGPDGGIYVLGGRRVPCCTVEQGGGAVATAERYDPRANRWTRLRPLPYAAPSLGAASASGTL